MEAPAPAARSWNPRHHSVRTEATNSLRASLTLFIIPISVTLLLSIMTNIGIRDLGCLVFDVRWKLEVFEGLATKDNAE